MELFKLFGRLGLEGVEAFNKDINSASESGDKLASKLGKGLKVAAQVGAAAVTAAATGISFLTKNSLASYAEYEQLAGGTQLLFGEAYDFIADKAANAFSKVQMSQNDYLQQANGFAVGLKTALGGNEQAAAELADKIITAEADIIAATGNSQEAVQNAFNGIMKSNFTMLDNLQLGITPTKEGFQEVIDKVNEWNTANGEATDYQIDNLADCQAALVDYVEMQGLAGYAAMEGASTLQGSTSAMKAAWQNLLTGMSDDSQDFDLLMNNLVESVGIVAGKFLPRIQVIFDAIPTLISGLAPQIPAMIQSILPGLLEGAVALVDGLVSALPEILSVFQVVIPILLEGVSQVIQSLSLALPEIITTIISFITDPATMQSVLSAVIVLLMAFTNAIPQIVTFLSETLPDIIATVVNFVTAPGNLEALLNAAVSFFMAIITAIPTIVTALVQALPNIIQTVVDFLSSGDNWQMIIDATIMLLSAMIEAIPTIIMALIEAGPQIIQGLIEGLMAGVVNLSLAISEIGTSIIDKFKSIFGIGGGKSTVMGEQGTALASGVKSGLEGLPEDAASTFDAMNANITKSVSDMTAQVSTDFSQIGTDINSISLDAGAGVSTSFEGMRTSVSDQLTSTNADVTSQFQNIKTTTDSQLTATATVVEDKFSTIMQTVTEKMNLISETVKNAIEEIKEAFNVDLKFKSVTVPKFKLSGEFNTETGEVPKVSASGETIYFAKGGIVDSATLFGMLGNRPMVAGESGPEAIAPIDTLQNYVAEAVASQNAGLVDVLNRILSAIVAMDENMGGNLKEALDGTSLSVNKREFGRLVTGVI